jgi:HEAT repeats
MNKQIQPLRRRILLPLLLLVLVAAVTWCATGMVSAPELDVASTDGLATEPGNDVPQSGGRDDRTRADDPTAPVGFYGARVGSLFSWRFHYTTSYRLDVRATENEQPITTTGGTVSLPFHGVLRMQILHREVDDITVLVKGLDVDATLPDEANERGTASVRSLCDGLEAWFLVRIDARGTILGYAFQDGRTPEQRNFVRALVAGFFHTIPARRATTWTAVESDPTGIYTADYRVVSPNHDATEIERTKRIYTTIGKAATVREHALSGRSRARFDRSSGWLAGVQIDESLTMELTEFPARVNLTVVARFEPTVADWNGLDLDESQWPSFVSASGANEDLAAGAAANQREQWRAKTADLSLDELLTKIRELIEGEGTRSAEFYRLWELLSWKLKLDPSAVAAAQGLLLGRSLDEETGSMLLTALGKAGSKEAQNTLLAVYGSSRLEAGWRQSAALSMFQLAEPTADVLKTVTDGVRNLRSIDDLDATTVLLLGTIAPRNGAALPNGKTAMAELAGMESRMRDLGRTGLWLDALGNAAVPSVAPLAAKYLRDANPLVRESALVALDQSTAKGVAPRLIAAAERDPSRDVRLAAIRALGRRRSNAGRQSLRNLATSAKDAVIRRAAMRAVARARRMNAKDRSALQGIARSDANQELRETARRLLRRK